MDYRALAEELLTSITRRRMPTEETRRLNSGETGILTYLHLYKNAALAGEISRDLGITTGRTAIALKNLEKKGLIRRGSSEGDRRCVVVHITEAGAAAAEECRVRILDSTQRILEYLGEADAREYVRLIGRVCEFKP